MKKGFLLCLCGFISLSLSAQKTTEPQLAKQLLQLLDYAKDGFKSIKGEPDKVLNEKFETSNRYFKTSFKLEEATSSTIHVFYSTVSFNAYFGKNLTKTGGKELFNYLSQVIKGGFADGFTITKSFGTADGDYYDHLTVKRDNDKFHSITLTFVDGDIDENDPIRVYITVE